MLETTEKQRQGRRKTKKKHKKRNRATQPGGNQGTKERDCNGQRKGEAHEKVPRRLAGPTGPQGPRTGTHAWDLGVVSSNLNRGVSASTQNSPGAPTEAIVEGRLV